MSYEENKAQLRDWLEELNPYRRPKGEFFRLMGSGENRGYVVLCTGAHSYHLSFADDYLGAIASCRLQRPGEGWVRGNDLHDGKFSRETFDAIIRDIFAYELVELAPIPTPRTVPVTA